MGVILNVSNLSISYDEQSNTVVNDFNLNIESGKIVAIVGESGCGKTSVIRAIMGILPATGIITKGQIVFDNIDLLKEKKYKKGKDIAFVFQNSGSVLNPVYTIGQQYIEYIRIHQKMSRIEAKALAIETMKKVNLMDAENLMHTYPFELSGGMQQRVGIAMAITFNPKLILADEPTSALDVSTQIQVINLLKEINEKYGTTIMMVTHNLGVASYLANDCIVMLDGKIMEYNTMEEIIKNPTNSYTRKLISSTVFDMEVENDTP